MIAAAVPQKLTRNEGLKESSPLLAGTIHQTLEDAAADRFSDEDYEFLKFHGIYQQDDRDKRKGDKQYILMVRTKFPGGVLSARQYLVCDDLANRYGNNTLRITTRQDFQFHGIVKANLRQTMRSLNEALMSTIAACGDVERNVMARQRRRQARLWRKCSMKRGNFPIRLPPTHRPITESGLMD